MRIMFSKRHGVAISLIVAAAFAALLWPRGARTPAERVETNPEPTLAREDATRLLARYYPAVGSDDFSRSGAYLKLQATADGFAVVPSPLGEGRVRRRWSNPAQPVRAVFPKTFDAPVRVRSGAADVSARPLGAKNVPGEIAADGSLVYRDAFPGCDVVYRCTDLKTEEFIIVLEGRTGVPARREDASPAGRDARPTTRSFTWALDLGAGQAALKARLTPMHTIELCDTKGVPRLRIDLPEGKDADGKLLRAGKELAYTLAGEQLTLAADLSGAKFPVVIDPSWSSTGSMAVGRIDHAAVQLPTTGEVLVLGGQESVYLASCELFDPITETWRSTGALNTGRAYHTATVLPNGKVLAAGGLAFATYLSSCELYDPSTGSWTVVGPMTNSRMVHTATLLNNGRILVAGGTAGSNISTSELYDAASGTWSLTGSLATARYLHTATLLGNGTVLVAGGAGGFLSSCEIYDPTVGTWSPTADMAGARRWHTATQLQDGKVLVIGGDVSFDGGVSSGNFPSCEIYEPIGGTWVATPSMVSGREAHAACLIGFGRVLVVGGSVGIELALCELGEPSSGGFSAAAQMLTARKEHTVTLLGNGKSLAVGGVGSAVALTSCELFDPAPEAFSQTVSIHASATGTSINVILQGNALDNPLTYVIVNQPSRGSLAGLSPNLTYTSTGGFVGTDSFTFKVNDGGFYGDSAPATVTINVLNTNPVAADQTASTHFGVPASVTLGATDADADPLTFAVVGVPVNGVLTGTPPNLMYAPNAGFVGNDSFTFKANDGAADSNVATVTINVLNANPVAAALTVSTHFGVPVAITLGATDADSDPLTFSVVAQPANGTLSGSAPNLTYAPNGVFVGTDSFTFKVNDGAADSIATVTINVANTAPTVIANATPMGATPNQVVTFSASGSDADGDALTYAWTFGDGGASSEQNPAHAYAEVGSYIATCTVADAAGGTGTASVIINVSKAPVVRLATSEVVGFGGLPLLFDAGFSTDPENAIASYTWNFGDGSPPGSGQVISKVYDQPGTYTVTLTITDAAGVSSTIERVIEVLGAEQAGLFNGFVAYKVKWNRDTESKDSLSLSAMVNVGDVVVGAGTAVALEIAGQRFTGTLDLKLRDSSDPNVKWQVKANLRGQPFGTVALKVKIRNADLGLGFNQAGALAGGDPHEIVTVDIPVTVEVGGRAFQINATSDFKFNSNGRKARGEGED